jgi:hypothetical protein
LAFHDLPLPRSYCGAVRFLQPSRAIFATDLDGLAADFDFDGISIQLAVASRTSSFNHGFALQYPKFGRESSRPSKKKGPLSESLVICLNGFSDAARIA